MKESKLRGAIARNCRIVLGKVWGVFSWNDRQLGTFKASDMLETLEAAWKEWEYAKQYFNSVNDPDLIDHAIYYMGATEKKYVYLLKKARENGINIEMSGFATRVG